MTYREEAKTGKQKHPAHSMTATAMNLILPDGASPIILLRTKEGIITNDHNVHCKNHSVTQSCVQK